MIFEKKLMNSSKSFFYSAGNQTHGLQNTSLSLSYTSSPWWTLWGRSWQQWKRRQTECTGMIKVCLSVHPLVLTVGYVISWSQEPFVTGLLGGRTWDKVRHRNCVCFLMGQQTWIESGQMWWQEFLWKRTEVSLNHRIIGIWEMPVSHAMGKNWLSLDLIIPEGILEDS
jgi:hypothetical protein